jgi:hypothetical protein
MKIALECILWFLLSAWSLIIVSIIAVSFYSALRGTPEWVYQFFNKIPISHVKRVLVILALAMGLTAFLLSAFNTYHK